MTKILIWALIFVSVIADAGVRSRIAELERERANYLAEYEEKQNQNKEEFAKKVRCARNCAVNAQMRRWLPDHPEYVQPKFGRYRCLGEIYHAISHIRKGKEYRKEICETEFFCFVHRIAWTNKTLEDFQEYLKTLVNVPLDEWGLNKELIKQKNEFLANIDAKIYNIQRGQITEPDEPASPPSQREEVFKRDEIRSRNDISWRENFNIQDAGTLKDGRRQYLPGVYAPPYTIHARCKTDSNNIRILLLDGEIIFNWECDKNDLRLDIPSLLSSHHQRGSGYVGVDKYVDIIIKVTSDRLQVYVDYDCRYTGYGNFKNEISKIGIRSMPGSVVTVEKFFVTK